MQPSGVFTYDANRDDAVLQWSQKYDAQLTGSIKARITTIAALAEHNTNSIVKDDVNTVF